jgi:chromosome segregation ATPase
VSKEDAYRQKIEAEIEEQKANLDALKAQAKKKVAEGKLGVYEEIEKLEKKLEEAKSTMSNLKNSGEEALGKLSQSLKGMFSKSD